MSTLRVTLQFVRERLLEYRSLVGWALVGCLIATALTTSLALYVDVVFSELLTDKLDKPPMAFRYRYLGIWEGNTSLEKVQQVDTLIHQTLVPNMPTPLHFHTSYRGTGLWTSETNEFSLGNLRLGTLNHSQSLPILSGEWSNSDTLTSDEGIYEALIPQHLFEQAGLQVGDLLTLRSGSQTVQLHVQAIWQPSTETDADQILPASFFNDVILIPTQALEQIIGYDTPRIEDAAWYQSYDLAPLRTTDVSQVIRQGIANDRRITAQLAGTRTEVTPLDNLQAFEQEVGQITRQLVIILAPIGGLVLYFMNLVTQLIVNRQIQDDVRLRSRGMSRMRLLHVHLLMWLVIALIALMGGLLMSSYWVNFVARTTSFLRFDGDISSKAVVFTPTTFGIASVAALVAINGGISSAWQSTGQNINSYHQLATTPRSPWWQRVYLDGLLLLFAIYVHYSFTQRELENINATRNPFSDPSVFVAPSLFALASVLVAMRFLPVCLRLAEKVIQRSNALWLTMTLRELTRSLNRYRSILIMLAFTLSLTGFTASMANTLDRSLKDQVDYQIGADLVVTVATDANIEQQRGTGGANNRRLTGYNIPPVSQLTTQPGVYAVSRVGRYTARFQAGSQSIEGIVLGVDRQTMADVTRFRSDYAQEPIGVLMNRLAQNRNGVLVSRAYASQYNIVEGQNITLQLQALDNTFDWQVVVLGMMDYFPSFDPRTTPFVIANIDPLFERVGSPLPHDFWLAARANSDAETIYNIIAATDFPLLRGDIPDAMLRQAQLQPGRQGVLGFLSLGFIASILLTMIATIIQSTAAFRAQSVQLATLQAMGLPKRTVYSYIITLQALLVLSGVGIGTIVGMLTTRLYLPLLDFSGGLPPYFVQIAWGDLLNVYAVFTIILLLAVILMTLALNRQSISALVRLGDAA